MNRVIPIVFALLLNAQTARGAVRPNRLFSDHAVLQRDSEVPVWGTAAEGERITVRFNGQVTSTTAKAGTWMVRLKPMPAGGPFAMTIEGENTVTVEDVLVGEVWVCAGQSNMEWALFRCTGGEEAVANSANPSLRLFTVPHNNPDAPATDTTGHWSVSGPATTKAFSAVAYYFGSKLQKELGVPVGLINTSWGGTNIEAWISRPALESQPSPRDRFADFARMKAEYADSVARNEAAKRAQAEAVSEAKSKGQAPPPPPPWLGPWRGPSTMYHGMIAPLRNGRIRGVAWYQGESNAYPGRASTYKTLLPILIRQWRADWGQGEFPFLIVQIAPNRKKTTDPNVPSGIAEVREAQLRASLSEPNSALVVTTDLGDDDGDVHYKRKEPVGDRLVRAALAVAYGRAVEPSGPIFREMRIEGDRAILRFSHVGGGLVAKDGPLTGFAISGDDRRFVVADARIDGDTVVVSSPSVSKPSAVRYGWADFPIVNLWNAAGLPASPFRTDDWPLTK